VAPSDLCHPRIELHAEDGESARSERTGDEAGSASSVEDPFRQERDQIIEEALRERGPVPIVGFGVGAEGLGAGAIDVGFEGHETVFTEEGGRVSNSLAPVRRWSEGGKTMRKLILKMSITLDGFVGGADGKIDWLFKTIDDEARRWIAACIAQAGVHIMGSRTYADMAAYWPSSTDILAAPMNQIPKVVFSRTKDPKLTATTKALEDARQEAPVDSHDAASWGRPRIAAGDLAQEIARLKGEPGKDIIAHGGAGFARSLVASGLIDEYQLLVHPVALGRGLALFSELPRPLLLGLVSTTRFAGGAVAHVLRPA
jgi:dihydrofolate reductase